jgi:acyl-CoA thioesterase-1
LIIARFLYRLLRGFTLPGLLVLSLLLPVQALGASILVLGDSISAAYGMSLDQGWVALLERRIASNGGKYRIVNASISGETSAGGLRRLPALLEQHQPRLVIIELGANDALRGYPIPRFRANLESMVALSRDAGASALLLPMEIPPNYGPRYTNDFRNAFATVAEETEAQLAPFILDGVATDPALMQEDGLHPRVEAQPIMLENILPAVLQALEES